MMILSRPGSSGASGALKLKIPVAILITSSTDDNSCKREIREEKKERAG